VGLPDVLLKAGYEDLLRPILFASHGGDPEAIHEQLIGALSAVSWPRPVREAIGVLTGSSGRPTRVAGIAFPSRVGLAAGLDKDASAVLAWRSLGFGFAEVGTVTAKPQPGNPRPRVFRLASSHALINRMGFNNPGAARVAATLAARGVRRGNNAAGVPVGVSIGKTKVVELEDAVTDYLASLRMLAPYADYIAVNVSSPNTPGLRSLQDSAALDELLRALTGEARALAGTADTPVPIFVKVAPDLVPDALDELAGTAEAAGVSGLIATNTTLARDGLAPADQARAAEAGGLSGAPLTVRARELVARLAQRTRLPVIASGGIMSPADAKAMFDAGAVLVQLYTGFIYHGPALPAAINRLDLAMLRA
jgi:dihydroorotate dehydrogenase